MSKTPPAKTTIPPASQSWPASRMAPIAVIPNPTRVRPVGVRPSLPRASANGSPSFLTLSRASLEITTLRPQPAIGGA